MTGEKREKSPASAIRPTSAKPSTRAEPGAAEVDAGDAGDAGLHVESFEPDAPAAPARTPANVDELMEQAEAALRAGRWFEAERHALRALNAARRVENWDAMARISLPLQEARRLRLAKAFDTKKFTIVEQAVHDADEVKTGCYLIQPPLVAADARRLRLAALRQEVPAAVLCREPLTKLKRCPIVAIGAVTIRARIEPPKNPKKPTLEWLIAAMEALGDAGIESIDTGLDLDRQIDHVLACLDAMPDHEKLHQILGDMCRRASKGFERRLPPRLFEDEDDAAEELGPA